MTRLPPTRISSPEELTRFMCGGTMGEHLGIVFTEMGPQTLVGRMPVGPATHQPMGHLHGGASVALAETVGSLAGWLALPDPTRQACVGLEVNANHLRPVKSGHVQARATPLHLGRRTHVWDIRVTHEETGALVCVARLTLAVVDLEPPSPAAA